MTMAGQADGRYRDRGSPAGTMPAVTTPAVTMPGVTTLAVTTTGVTTLALTTTVGAPVRPLVRRLPEPAGAPAAGQNSLAKAAALIGPQPDDAPAAGAALVIRLGRRLAAAPSHSPARRPRRPRRPRNLAGGQRLRRPGAGPRGLTCPMTQGRTPMPRAVAKPRT